MGRAVFEEESAFIDQSMPAAAVLCKTERGNLHMGLLYRGRDGQAEVLHLAWHDNLSREWGWRRMWAHPEVEPERLRSVGGYCRQIWKRYEATKRFAFALGYHGTTFDVSGNPRLGHGARGLSCATFVLAVLNSCGIELIHENDWPIRPGQDLAFVFGLESVATSEHYQMLIEEVAEGCRRITPDEVLGACACVDLPADFAPARAAANEILTRL